MRISDWSSDVCSSDLLQFARSAEGGSGRVGLLDPRAFEQRALDHRHDQLDLVGVGLEARGEAQRVLAAVDHAQALLAQPFLAGTGAVALEARGQFAREQQRSEETKTEHQSLTRISYADL